MSASKTISKNDSLDQLFISPKILNAAKKAGFTSVGSVFRMSKCALQERTGLSKNETEILFESVYQLFIPVAKTCWDLLQEQESSTQHLPLGCAKLDSVLRGGIPLQGITEISGEAGSGKTQIALQLALNSQLSNDDGGLGKGVVYLCTESRFPIDRLQQMICHMQERYSKGPKSYVNQLFIHQIYEWEMLLPCIDNQLTALISRQDIGLIIIDSLAAPFRSDEGPEKERLASFKKLRLRLHELNSKKGIGVIVLNQVAATLDDQHYHLYGQKSSVIPSLGLSWANIIATRLMISRTRFSIPVYQSNSVSKNQGNKSSTCIQCGVRKLEVIFSPWLSRLSSAFIITPNGIEDVAEEIGF